jgi:ferric-dicitrate binding protein FerR (iron transport regulator)
VNPFDDLRSRFASFAAGEATAAEIERLEEALASDPSVRRDYVEFMNLDAALENWAAGAVEVRPLRLASGVSPVRRWCSYAAALAAAVLFGWWLSGSSKHELVEGPPGAEPLPPTQATLVVAQECRWGDRSYREGQRLPAGPLRLISGNAVVRLDGGTLLMLRGDCDLDLRRDGRVDLRRGEITARSAEGADGFIVHVPGTTVVDLGTEFALRVDSQGRTEVHVVEGSVRLDRPDAAIADSPVLLAERAVRIDGRKSSAPETIAFGGEPIAAALARLRGRAAPKLRVHEPFDYAAGDHAPDSLAGGHGWQGPWRLPLERDGSRMYPGTQRLMPIVAGAEHGSAWETPAGKSFRVRSLSEPLPMADDDVFYIGLTIHGEQPVVPSNPHEKQGRSVRLAFRSDPSAEPESISFGFNGNQRPIIETSAGRSFVGRTTVPLAGGVRLVAKVLARARGEDELSLIFLDDRERHAEIEPPVWDVTSRGVELDSLLHNVFIASHGPAARSLDDLRVGATWWSVLQENVSP